LVGHLKVGPPVAKVENVTLIWSKYSGKYSHFSARY
jgi:hypothetical protein